METNDDSIRMSAPTFPGKEETGHAPSVKFSLGEGAEEKFEALIVGGGDFPTHPIPLQLMQTTERLVCCDGAANEFLVRGMRPWRVVGDCDSLSPDTEKAFADILRFNPDQETNDQTKAVTYLTQKGIHRIGIVAATGRREDHTLGNISLLIEYMRQGLEVHLYTDHGVFIPCRNTNTFECPTGTAVSIFSFGTCNMRAEGLHYPLRDFTNWWQGTLNKTDRPVFTIRCEGEYLVFLNYPEELATFRHAKNPF